MSSLVLYGSNVADSTLTTACDMAANSGGVETSAATTNNGLSGNFFEYTSKGLSSVPVRSSIPAPTGNGWVYQPGAGTFATGNWSPVVTCSGTIANAGNQTWRAYQYSGGVYTAIGSITFTLTGGSTKTTYTLTPTSFSSVTFGATDLLYIDMWYQDNSGAAGDTATVWESTSNTAGVANDMQVTTPNFTPTVAAGAPPMPVGEVRPRWVGRALSALLFQPFIPIYAWFNRALAAPARQNTQPVNIPRYVPRGLMSTLINFQLGLSIRFLLGLVKDTALRFRLANLKDVALRFLLASLKDTALRFRLAKLKDLSLRFRLTGSLLKDIQLRLRLGILKDTPLRLRLGILKDTALRFRIKSADQLKDLALRLRLANLKDTPLRFRLGILKDLALRFRLKSADQLKDLLIRLRLANLKDTPLRFRLGVLKDIALRFRLKSADQLRDLLLRFRLGLLKDTPLRLRLGILKDLALRFRLKSADQLKDLSLRFRLYKLQDLALRFRLTSGSTNLKDLSLRFRLANLKDTALRLRLGILKDTALRFRLRSADQLRDLALRFRLGRLRDASLRLRLANLKDLSLRYLLANLKNATLRLRLARLDDVPLRVRLRSADILRDVALRFRAARVRDCIFRFVLGGIQAGPPAFASEVISAQLVGREANSMLLSPMKSIQGTLLGAWGSVSNLLSSKSTGKFTATHQDIMPTPFTSIVSTITVTDANNNLVSNATPVTAVINFPDGSSTNLSLGSGITSLGSGQYQAAYNTKGPGSIREVWSLTVPSGNIASFQFIVETGY